MKAQNQKNKAEGKKDTMKDAMGYGSNVVDRTDKRKEN